MYFSEDIIILRTLFKNFGKEIPIFSFHKEYLLSPAQIMRSIKKFSKEDIVIISESKLKLTKIGYGWIIKNRKHLFINRKHYWKDIPQSMKFEGEVDKYYLPLDFKITDFEKYKRG